MTSFEQDGKRFIYIVFLPGAPRALALSCLGTSALRAHSILSPTSRTSSAGTSGALFLLLCHLGLDLCPGQQLLFCEHLLDRGRDSDRNQGLFARSLSQGSGCSLNGGSVFISNCLAQGLVRLLHDLVGCFRSLLIVLEDLLHQVLLFFA